MIKIHQVSKKFSHSKPLFHIGEYTFPRRGLIAITGASGSGKSTLLKMIAGLDVDYTGAITVQGQNLKQMDSQSRADFRATQIGFVFQSPSLLPLLSVEENIALPLEYLTHVNPEVRQQKIRELLTLVNLSDYQQRQVYRLSGGEKQRVALARSLAHDPMVILADEPTGALDASAKREVMELLSQIAQRKLVIVVSHDQALVKQFASQVLHLQNQQITIVSSPNLSARTSLPALIKITNHQPKFKLPFSFIFRYHLRGFRHKKGRTMITSFATSIGLTGIGLSLLVTSSVAGQINQVLSGLFNENQIVMEHKDRTAIPAFQYAATPTEVEQICARYPVDIREYGVAYQANFEALFPDENSAYLSSTRIKIPLSSFNIRHLSEYYWPDEIAAEILPSRPPIMENDQIILGLPLSDFNTIIQAHYLSPLTSYAQLATYIQSQLMTVTWSIANDSWQYADSQLFQVIGIYYSSRPQVVHNNPRWNQWVLETQMRLASTPDFVRPPTLPWTLKKVLFIATRTEIFYTFALYQPQLNQFLLQPIDVHINYSWTHEQRLSNLRLGVFAKKSGTINISAAQQILQASPGLISYFPTTSGSYLAYPQALLMGFAQPLFLSSNPDQLVSIIEQMPSETITALKMPAGSALGHFSRLPANNVTFGAPQSGFIYGRAPTTIDEIAISQGLADVLFSGQAALNQQIHLAYRTGEHILADGQTRGQFTSASLTITGINAKSQMEVIHTPDWLISFFALRLQIPASLLTIQHIIYEKQPSLDGGEVADGLNEQFSQYVFSTPTSELTASVTATAEQIEKIMLLISTLAMIISLMLMGIVTYLSMSEEVKTLKFFVILGFREQQIKALYLWLAPLLGAISLLIAFAQLVTIQLVLNTMLAQMFQRSGAHQLMLRPYLIMAALAMIISTISGFLATANLQLRKN